MSKTKPNPYLGQNQNQNPIAANKTVSPTNKTHDNKTKTTTQTPHKTPLNTTTNVRALTATKTPKRKLEESYSGHQGKLPQSVSKKLHVNETKTTVLMNKPRLAKLHLDEDLEKQGEIKREEMADKTREFFHNKTKTLNLTKQNSNSNSNSTKAPKPNQNSELESMHPRDTKPKLPPDPND